VEHVGNSFASRINFKVAKFNFFPYHSLTDDITNHEGTSAQNVEN